MTKTYPYYHRNDVMYFNDAGLPLVLKFL